MKKNLLLFLLLSFTSYSQQDVFSRSEVSTGNWWDGANPWFYATWNNSQQRPDLNSPARNFVKIGHNNNLTMTTNGAFFTIGSLDFQAGASSVRTINSGGDGTGIGLTLGIYNASSATHVLNTDIGVDASTVQFQANGSGGLSFGNTIFINNNTAEFGGVSNISVSGKLTGSGGKLTKVGSGILTISNASNDYTGATTVTSGTLSVQKGGHTANITSTAIAFVFASPSQAAGNYNFLPGQLAGSTSRTLTSNLVAGKTVTFNYTTGSVTICDNVGLASATATATPICTNATTTLTYTGLTGTGALVSWTANSNGTGATYGTGTPSSAVGPGTYYAYATGSCGSPVSLQVIVGEKALPTVSVGNVSGCPDSSISLINVVSPPGGTGSYSVPLPYSGGNTTYTYTYTAPNGCTATSDPGTITIVPNITPTVGLTSSDGDNTFVYGTPVTFTAVGASLGGGSVSNYDFKVNGTTVQTGVSNTYTVSNLANGNQVSVVITITGGTCLTTSAATSNTITNTVTGAFLTSITNYCGQTLPFINSGIGCSVPSGVVGTLVYRFKVKNNVTGVTAPTIDRSVPNFNLTMTSVYTYSTSFDVQVAAIVNGVEQPYSAVCVITSPAPPSNAVGPCTQTLAALNSRIFV
ncbi:beta strand repeat-containing protein, partial [Flavobacterium sp. RSB2_4_14]|uniref:beta strand repeat-containing protein n=1 Tax=Flavobacterium sp. RSB2_4_14 TaxID=3447665 RepID=UPI003F36A70C